MPRGLQPLGARVPFSRVEAPAHPSVASWRPVSDADVDALLALKQAQDRVDHPNYLSTREEVVDELSHSYLDRSRDTIIGLSEKGEAIAYGFVILPPGRETIVRSVLFGGVHPRWRSRGIGRKLLAWQTARAREQLRSVDVELPGWIVVYADERAPQTAQLLQRDGFTVSRYFSELERPLGAPIGVFATPGDLRVEQYTADRSEAVRLARNASFQDHWGSQSVDPEQWAGIVGASTCRPDLSFLAIAPDGRSGDEVVGFVLTEVIEDDWETQGFSSCYIPLVGVVREWRRRGVAAALLAKTLLAAQASGLDKAALDVDTENPSGALGLYMRMGFEPQHRSLCLTKVY